MNRGYFSGCVALLLLTTASAIAGISADTTRIIFQDHNVARGKSVGLTSSVASPSPYLVKAQMTRDSLGEDNQVPFVTTPSLFRLEPGSTSQVLIKKMPAELPKNRESLFYFRAVAMPAGQAGSLSSPPAVAGSLQVATATVLKFFYRPASLAIPHSQAMSKLQFSADSQGLKVTNPTPYYITLSSLRVGATQLKLRMVEGSSMIAPYTSAIYPGVRGEGAVEWRAINDYGGTEIFHGKVP